MNFRLILSASTLAVATLTSAGAFAQAAAAPTPAAPTVDQREAKQHNRIKEGRESGELTKKESVRLHAEQRAIKHKEKKAGADGVVTAKEQKHIDRMQNGANKDIAKQKHDAQTPASK